MEFSGSASNTNGMSSSTGAIKQKKCVFFTEHQTCVKSCRPLTQQISLPYKDLIEQPGDPITRSRWSNGTQKHTAVFCSLVGLSQCLAKHKCPCSSVWDSGIDRSDMCRWALSKVACLTVQPWPISQLPEPYPYQTPTTEKWHYQANVPRFTLQYFKSHKSNIQKAEKVLHPIDHCLFNNYRKGLGF